MRKRYSISIIVVTVIALLLIGLKLLGGFWPFRVINDQIMNPIGGALVSLGNGLKSNIEIVTKAANLSKENKAQESEILNLKQQLSTLKEVANENQLLRSQLQFNERLSLNLTPARVVASDGNSIRKFVTIDRGSSSGLKKGMAVVSSGVLVGTIDEVNDYSSSVFLSTDPEFRIRGLGQDGRAQGIVSGQLGAGYLFDKIAQNESLSPNEMVITAGSGEVPKGILIGQVENVQKVDNAVFQSAELKPLVSTSNLELVFVVTGLKQ